MWYFGVGTKLSIRVCAMLIADSPTTHPPPSPSLPSVSSTADGMMVLPSMVSVRTPLASPIAATVLVVPKSMVSTQ
jgi:hypothetical protein